MPNFQSWVEPQRLTEFREPPDLNGIEPTRPVPIDPNDALDALGKLSRTSGRTSRREEWENK